MDVPISHFNNAVELWARFIVSGLGHDVKT